jgi:glycine betaine/proline transport system substrate-binding protein
VKIKSIIIAAAVVAVLMTSLLVGCDGSNGSSEEKGTIELIYVQWACAEAETHVTEAVLEDMGYEVNKSVVDAGVMWQAVANGDSDAFTTAWLPYTHESYWEKYQDQVVNLGSIYDGAVLGIVVPQYVTIDSLAEMADYKDEFGGRIVGIDPGAGIMQHTREDTMPTYGLDDWELVESSGSAMMAELDRAYNNEEWVAVTGWKPHYMFFPYDLKILEDPEKTLGEAEEIDVIVRQGFEEDFPDAAKMLSNMYFTDAQLGEVMYNINVDGMDPEEAGEKWVDENPNIVSSWIAE